MRVCRLAIALGWATLSACSSRTAAPPAAVHEAETHEAETHEAETHEAEIHEAETREVRPEATVRRPDTSPPPPPPLAVQAEAPRKAKDGAPAAGGSGAANASAADNEPAATAPRRGRDALAKITSSAGPAGPAAPAAPAGAAALQAGRHDDNKEYPRFLDFLRAHASATALPWDVSERLTIRSVDVHDKSMANCAVQVLDLKGKILASSTTYADGQTQFFPAAASAATDQDYSVQARCGSETHTVQLARRGRRQVEVRFGSPRQVPARVPLDVAIVLDTTGSMQSQIDRLKQTLAAIHFQISQLPSQPEVRFGAVAYRDRGDDYVTQVTPFTGDVQAFQQVLDRLTADGGGDTPEDMQSGLDQALHALHWRDNAIRLGFVVADAPPHTDYGQAFDYRAAMQESLQRGIKWTGVGVGGLPVEAEVVLRQLAQATLGEYVFVTSGDGGDSDGNAHEASHHVGSNYHAENLDQAMVRIVRRELSYLGEEPRDFDDTIRATALSAAMGDALRQLADYSALPLGPHTPAAVLPVHPADKTARPMAARLSDELTLAASRHPSFRVLERDLQALAQELKVQLSDLADDTQAVPLGKLMGAQLLVVSKVTVHGDRAELFARLVRVETGEILSVAKVDLGPVAP